MVGLRRPDIRRSRLDSDSMGRMVRLLRVRAAALLRLDITRLLTDRWRSILACSGFRSRESGCSSMGSGEATRRLCASGLSAERGSGVSLGTSARTGSKVSSAPVHPTHGGGTSPSPPSCFRFSLVLRTLKGVSGLPHAEWSLCLRKAGLVLGESGLTLC